MKARVQYSLASGEYVVECREKGWFKPWVVLRRFDFRGLADQYLATLTVDDIRSRLAHLQELEQEEERRRATVYPEKEL